MIAIINYQMHPTFILKLSLNYVNYQFVIFRVQFQTLHLMTFEMSLIDSKLSLLIVSFFGVKLQMFKNL